MVSSIYESASICKTLLKYNLCENFTRTVMKHIFAVLISVFLYGYKGKTVQFAEVSPCHRTTVAHFLNKGKWDSAELERRLKKAVIQIIYAEAVRSGQPILCLVDDTVSSKTKPLSQASHPIEDAYFHYSHLKRRKDYGHQAVGVMLSCNGITLNYAMVLYDKTKSKIQIVREIASELPHAPVLSYFLCDSWYACAKIATAFRDKGFHTIGAVKSNRLVTCEGCKLQIRQLAHSLHFAGLNADLVTVGKRQFFVYSRKVRIDGIGEAVILICYARESFGEASALRAFLCTDISLSSADILNRYAFRWKIEVFFRHAKQRLAFDKYQIRSSTGIQRFWLLMSLAHFICCMGSDTPLSFEDGYAFFQRTIRSERITFIYQCGYAHISLDHVLSLIA